MDKTKNDLLKRKEQIAKELTAKSKQLYALQDEIRSLEFQYRNVLDAIYAPALQK